MAVLVAATMLFAACTQDTANVKLAPTLATTQVLNVTSNVATVVGYVVAAGDGFTEKGVCYNIATGPSVANSKVAYTGQATTATFNVSLTGLTYATKYYARAYATGAAGTIYGEEYNFTTLPVVATVTTAAITAITGNAAAGGGNVTVNGGADVTARGICFGIAHNPTIADGKTADGKGSGAFVSALASLKGNTTYYVRSYATNSAGTAYGPEVTFKTLVDLPVVTTAAVTGATKVAAVSGGEVTADGGGDITAKGLAWGTGENPTIDGSKIDGGTGLGAFVSNLAGLSNNTVYHVRAFATNSAGTAYGADVRFTTLADIRIWNIPGDYAAASYPAAGFANWSPFKSPQVQSLATSADKLEGYVFFSAPSNQWKFADAANDPANAWSMNWGSTTGALVKDGANIVSPGGYYKINADATAMTYTAVATIWGVIGDATAGGWGDQTNMVYDPSTQKFSLGANLIGGKAFKFRGTSDWAVNYGSDAADGTLGAGAGNIPVTVTSDYFITLDLSHPNVYTYSANRWGVIGDATPDGWNSDQNMSWDAANKVLTITLDLKVGSFKFRANDDWALNYGGSLDALSGGGDNIAVAAAGNYTLTFDPVALKATVTKN